MSYGKVKTVVDLQKTGTTLILGEDLDNTTNGQSSNGVGKAQPLHCNIKTPSGWTTMGDIQTGDDVITPDGSVAKVIDTFPQEGVRPTYKIRFGDGRETEADSEHLWSVFSPRWGSIGERGTKTLTTLELEQLVMNPSYNRNSYKIFVPLPKHEDISDAQLPLDPYLLGALLGDGRLTDKTPKFTSIDAHIVNRVNEQLITLGQHLRLFGRNNTKDYVVCNNVTRSKGNTLRSILMNIGVWGCYSYEKFIPDQYMLKTSQMQKLQLLQGLLDTDGTVGKTHNISFSSTSLRLATDVQYLVRSLGGTAKMTTRLPFYKNKNNERIPGRPSFNVSINYHTPSQLFSLTRKKDRVTTGQTQYANMGLRIDSIDFLGMQNTKCIMIDHPDHLYITDNFIVTHNTTLMNALTYAIYDRPISDIKVDDLINNINGKNLEVIVEFEKGGVQYKIERRRKSGKSGRENSVHFFVNGDNKARDSVKNTDLAIQDVIGMPYDMFVRIVVISANHTPFLDMPVNSHYQANQTDFIERLFNLTVLSEQAVILKEMIKSNEDSMTIQKVRIEQLEKEHSRYNDQLKVAQQRVETWSHTNAQTIVDYERKLEEAESVDVEVEKKLHTEVTELEKQLKDNMLERKQLKASILRCEKTIKDSTHELIHLSDQKCPYCLQQFADAESKISQCTDNLEEAKTLLSQYSERLDDADADDEDLSTLLKIKKKQKQVDDIEQLVEIHTQKQVIIQKVEDLTKSVNPFLEPLRELEQLDIDPIDYTNLNEMKKTQDHQQFLLKLLTKKDSFVRKALLNRNLPFLNMRLHHYLTQVGLVHRVEFTHEMTAKISLYGRPLSFGNLSNGQRARVNLALSLAFRDVLQKLHTPINICLLDEVLDVGLDSVGVQSSAKMLKKKARDEDLNIYIISHRDEIGSVFDRTLTVQMKGGFSSIQEVDTFDPIESLQEE